MPRAGLRQHGRSDDAIVGVDPNVSSTGKHQHSAEPRQGCVEIFGVARNSGFLDTAVRSPDVDAPVAQKSFASVGNEDITGISSPGPDQIGINLGRRQLRLLS